MPSQSELTAAFACNRSDDRVKLVAGIHVLHSHPFTSFDETPPSDAKSFIAMPIPFEILPQLVGDKFRHRLGTWPLDVANWLPSDPESALTIQMKQKLLAHRRDEVVSLFSGGDDAAQEAGELVSQWAGAKSTSTGIDALVDAALLVADDLAVLKPVMSSDGQERLLFVAGVVCGPSRWRLSDKMGNDMIEVHAPVAKYAEHVGAGVDTSLQRLSVDRPVWRSNWIIQDHPALFQPVIPPAPLLKRPQDLWIRMERQTLRRLPVTGGVLFTIRGFQQPLVDYLQRSKEIAQTMRTLLERLPDDVAQYKSVFTYRPEILSWMNQFC